MSNLLTPPGTLPTGLRQLQLLNFAFLHKAAFSSPSVLPITVFALGSSTQSRVFFSLFASLVLPRFLSSQALVRRLSFHVFQRLLVFRCVTHSAVG